MSDREARMQGERHGGFKSRDVLVHSCESTSCGVGERERTRGTRVCGIACGGKIKRMRSVLLSPTLRLPPLSPCFSPSLSPSHYLSLSLSLRHRLRLSHGLFSPFPPRSWSSSRKHATSFSLLPASSRCRVSLRLSLLLGDDSTPVLSRRSLVLCLLSSPFDVVPVASVFLRRRVFVIIADCLIFIN